MEAKKYCQIGEKPKSVLAQLTGFLLKANTRLFFYSFPFVKGPACR